jgi:hypothetical protein
MTEPNDIINPYYQVDNSGNPQKQYLGLTKREYFAALSMHGILSNNTKGTMSLTRIINDSIDISDLLIEELNKPKS